jgi:hypothetical protein
MAISANVNGAVNFGQGFCQFHSQLQQAQKMESLGCLAGGFIQSRYK